MSCHLHRSNRVERLVAVLGDLLEEPRGSVFDPEAVVVPGHGMAVWLSMQLSTRLGVWATPLLYPRKLVERVVTGVLGERALGPEPLRVLELFAPPPAAGASSAYARAQPYLSASRYADDELLGSWPPPTPVIERLRVVREHDVLYRRVSVSGDYLSSANELDPDPYAETVVRDDVVIGPGATTLTVDIAPADVSGTVTFAGGSTFPASTTSVSTSSAFRSY
jgi:hypothetical protein